MTFANRNQGGSGAYARSLFASLRDRGEIIPWVMSGPRRPNLIGTMRWLVRGGHNAVTERPPDILHCPSFVMPWAIKIPMVVTAHDAASMYFPGDHPLEWRVYVKALLPRRLRAAARVITGSEFGRREVIRGFGLDPARVVVVHYGLDPYFLKHGLTPPATNGAGALLFPGAPIGRKNLEPVLRSMAAARPDSALGKVLLEVTGANEREFPTHSKLIRALGLQSRVRWLGQAPLSELPSIFARASAVVYPSLYEGFGFPPLEAMAVGTPVVASDRGSLPEVLGDAALMVDPTDPRALADALEAVLSRPELRDRLRQAGARQSRLYTWEKCADRTMEVYKEVLATPAVAS